MDQNLLGRIPLTARVVLLAGCGDGALGAAYLRRNPQATMYGIEADPALAAVAATRLHKVFADSAWPGDLRPQSIDCLVYGEAFVCHADFAAVLARHEPYLAPDGVILLAAPNAEHWRRIEKLLRGTADFAGPAPPARNAVEQILRNAGLRIAEVLPLGSDPDGAEIFADLMAPALAPLGIAKAGLLERTTPEHLVWRAQAAQREPIRIVSTILYPVGGVSHVRVTEPMQALAAHPDVIASIAGPNEAYPGDFSGPKVYVFHRPLLEGDSAIGRIRMMLEMGWVIVCEFDDHPDYIDVLKVPDLHNFDAMHGIQTSTDALADVLRARNPEVAVFPNAVAELPDVVNYNDPDCITLFCAGLNRQDESPPYVAVFNSVAQRAGARLRFRIVGDAGLYRALQTPHKSYIPICGYDTYQQLLAQSEMSFMPLRDTPFNRCKSDLKFIEAAAHRVTALAGDTMYPDTIDDRRTGLIFASPAELEHNLRRVLDNPEFGRRIADNARAYVTQHRMLAYQVEARVAWYKSLWARREELTRSLLERVPQLRG